MQFSAFFSVLVYPLTRKSARAIGFTAFLLHFYGFFRNLFDKRPRVLYNTQASKKFCAFAVQNRRQYRTANWFYIRV